MTTDLTFVRATDGTGLDSAAIANIFGDKGFSVVEGFASMGESEGHAAEADDHVRGAQTAALVGNQVGTSFTQRLSSGEDLTSTGAKPQSTGKGQTPGA